MEQTDLNDIEPKESKKLTEIDENAAKKPRLDFNAHLFRKQIHTDQKIPALQEFKHLLSGSTKQECILSYLDSGGTCTKILQIMETDSTISPLLILEIVYEILLQINAKYFHYQTSAYESCRYLLNTYATLINKMLGLSSSTNERLVILKLLTAIVTFSAVLAKDILLHVNFNPTNLEILTKVRQGTNEVRNAFVHFITAFLVDGHFPTLSVLLEKKGFMTSIISGLKFDRVNTVILVVTALKNHILENSSVSKTLKMKAFNTPVVKDLVNLYNWKGPAGVPDPKKKTKLVVVDEIEKSKVNEAVHSFLLALCTSHKYGIIFKDHSAGLSGFRSKL